MHFKLFLQHDLHILCEEICEWMEKSALVSFVYSLSDFYLYLSKFCLLPSLLTLEWFFRSFKNRRATRRGKVKT